LNINVLKERTKEKRKLIAREYVRTLVIDNVKMIYLDECSFNLEQKNSKSWGVKGEKNVYHVNTKSLNISLIAAISNNEIIGWKFV
jgi:hypothetical protein